MAYSQSFLLSYSLSFKERKTESLSGKCLAETDVLHSLLYAESAKKIMDCLGRSAAEHCSAGTAFPGSGTNARVACSICVVWAGAAALRAVVQTGGGKQTTAAVCFSARLPLWCPLVYG